MVLINDRKQRNRFCSHLVYLFVSGSGSIKAPRSITSIAALVKSMSNDKTLLVQDDYRKSMVNNMYCSSEWFVQYYQGFTIIQ